MCPTNHRKTHVSHVSRQTLLVPDFELASTYHLIYRRILCPEKKVLNAKNYHRQCGEGQAGLLVGIVLVVGIAIWQIHRGATVQKIGIPGVFEINLGATPAQFCMSEDIGYDRFGSDYNGGPRMKDLQQCESSCLLDDKCQALSFHKSSSQCWLKTAPGLRRENTDYVAAVKNRC
jgi:hypothetical protein